VEIHRIDSCGRKYLEKNRHHFLSGYIAKSCIETANWHNHKTRITIWEALSIQERLSSLELFVVRWIGCPCQDRVEAYLCPFHSLWAITFLLRPRKMHAEPVNLSLLNFLNSVIAGVRARQSCMQPFGNLKTPVFYELITLPFLGINFLPVSFENTVVVSYDLGLNLCIGARWMKGERVNILMMHLGNDLLARNCVGTQMLAIVSPKRRTCHTRRRIFLNFAI
jgi:hypothetical protein